VLQAADAAARSALGGKRTVMILKQLKGAGVHKVGAKAHNLYPADTLDAEHIVAGLQRRALAPEAWKIVRDNFSRAGGGPAAKTVVTEHVLDIVPLPELPIRAFEPGDKQVPATAFGALVAAVGQSDPYFVVTNADGNEASAMANINAALKIRHPVEDPLYFQEPNGQVYEPLNEDACAGLAAGMALFGARSVWLSYESFAINGWPIVQTVTQAMAELRRKTPSFVCMFTAGALEQGRNGWTHQRPEIENYFAAQMRNGNMYPLFPCDANQIQVAYDWALGTHNKGIAIIASKSPLPVYTTLDQAREGIERGAVKLYESASKRRQDRGVRGHRRHGAAAGVRGEGQAGSRRPQGAHRQRRQPAPAVPSDRCGLGYRVGTRQRLHGRRPFQRAVRCRRADRGQRRPLRPAGADPAAHPRRAPRRDGLEARRNHRQPGRNHGLQRPDR
jgi:phosphoketolase